MNDHYYISTGAKDCFYTLRYSYLERVYMKFEGTVTDSKMVERDYHICNLSTDRETAIAKAVERVGGQFNPQFDVQPIHRRAEVDWSVFQAGKYEGKSIHEIRETDPGYLVWVCENLPKSRQYEKTVELAKALVAHELEARQAERDAKKAAEKAAQDSRIKAYAPYAELFKGMSGDFCEAMAEKMEAGDTLTLRMCNVIADVLGRMHGRRNSKAYWARYEEVAEVLKGANPELNYV